MPEMLMSILPGFSTAGSRKKKAPKPGPKGAPKEKSQQKDLDAELREGIRACFCALREAGRGGGGAHGADPTVSVTTAHGRRFHCTALEARRFSQLRAIWGLTDDAFWSSLCDGELPAGTTQASGKSGSIFWFTADKLLVIKSVTRSELGVLLGGLDAYKQHFVANRSSLLSRFFSAFEVRGDDIRVQMVVMNHVFAGHFPPHVIYDLKGTTEDRWVNPRPGVVLKDLNFADKIIGIANFRDKVDLLHALRQDTSFLKDHNVMDYSVCLGVHYCDDEVSPSTDQVLPPSGISSEKAVLRGFEPKFQCTLVRDQAARRVVYFIGIIDILQHYDIKKCAAHVIKSLSLGLFHEIDSVPPSYYARRFKTTFLGKVQTFREPGDRVARFVRRLQAGIDNGTIPRPTFAVLEQAPFPSGNAVLPGLRKPSKLALVSGQTEQVTMDESIDFAVRCGGHLQLLRRPPLGGLRSRYEEVEAFLDMDRHALVFQVMSKGIFGIGKRSTSAVACYKIRRVYLSIVCHRPRDRYCNACHLPIKIEAEPVESRRFTVEADDMPLRFTAPSRRQAKLWVTALEVAASYAEANVEDVEDAAASSSQGGAAASNPRRAFLRMSSEMSSPVPSKVTSMAFVSSTPSTDNVAAAKVAMVMRAALLGSLEPYLQEGDIYRTLLIARTARQGMLETYLMGPEAERRWEKRRVKWIFGFVDIDGTGNLALSKVKTLWSEMNINANEGQEVLSKFLKEAREGRRAGGGRQIGGGRVIHLADFRRMLHSVDAVHARAVRSSLGVLVEKKGGLGGPAAPSHERAGAEDALSPEDVARFFARVQQVVPPPSVGQVKRLLGQLTQPLVTRNRFLTPAGLAQLLCSPSNALIDPAKRPVFQDMNQPLSAYFIETSHNTYLEGNQLSSRSSVLRYVEVLRNGCRSVEVDAWDGADGEPVVKHGYTVTTEVLFEDVIDAIADHAFVASDYPVIISIEQHCSALQRTRQGEILMKVLGSRLLMPPWDESKNDIDYEKMESVSPASARGRFLVKSSRGCCERCRSPLPVYDRCIALPTMKLLKREKHEIQTGATAEDEDAAAAESEPEPARQPCHVSSMTAGKVLKLRQTAGEESLRLWNSQYLTRAYPEGTRIGSGNIDPLALWLCGVQMVALNYQTPDQALLLNEGLFRSYNGGCGYVLKGPELQGLAAQRSHCKRLRLRICCGHRLPRPEAPSAEGLAEAGGSFVQSAAVSCPSVVVGLEPGGQISQTRAVMHDGYHPIFNHEVDFVVPDAPFHILTFEVLNYPNSRPIARRAVSLDAVREGFRWLGLRSTLGNTVPHGGLLVYVEFRSS